MALVESQARVERAAGMNDLSVSTIRMMGNVLSCTDFSHIMCVVEACGS